MGPPEGFEPPEWLFGLSGTWTPPGPPLNDLFRSFRGYPPLGTPERGFTPPKWTFWSFRGGYPPLWDPYKGGILQKADAYFLK